LPDFEREPLEGDGRGVPVLARVVLPLGPDLVVALADRDLALLDALLELGVAGDPRLADAGELRDADRRVAERAHRARLHAAIVQDRKSTRLNSSHLG